MRLLFVADGPRDHVVIPELITGILGMVVCERVCKEWKGIRLGGSGYHKKLKFAVRQARDMGLE